VSIPEIAEMVQLADHRHGPVLIGVDGLGGSGKSEFAARLKQQLPDAVIICMDDFIVKDKMQATSWDEGVFDRARLEREILQPLTHQKKASYEKLDWDDNTLSSPQTVPSAAYVIVEGTTALHPDIAHYYDYTVWIDAPAEVAMQRGMARDRQAGNTNDALWPIWANNDTDYQDRHHPQEGVDFIFDNSGSALAPADSNEPVEK
jgi:uridine kinase